MKVERPVLNSISKSRLERVLAILNILEITKPNAEIKKKMGGSPGNISKYLNGVLPMSDNFYTTFLEKFKVEEGPKIESMLNEISDLKERLLENERKIKTDSVIIETLTKEIESLKIIISQLKNDSPSKRTGTEG